MGAKTTSVVILALFHLCLRFINYRHGYKLQTAQSVNGYKTACCVHTFLSAAFATAAASERHKGMDKDGPIVFDIEK